MNRSKIDIIRRNAAFIKEHLHQRPSELILKFGNDDLHQMLIKQIDARQKIRKKLPEWFENFEVVLPPGLPLEQASSEATARLKASLISGQKLLDATGGLGVDTTYLSTSFSATTYVERNPDLVSLAENNFEALGRSIDVKEGDGIEELQSSDADVVYLDPYRRDEHHEKVISLKEYQPDVTQLLDLLVEGGRQSLIKTSPMLDINQALRELKYVKEVWVISYRNECREVLYLLNADALRPLMRTFNIGPEQTTSFEFEPSDGATPLAPPADWLYEPNSSILKARGQEAAARQHQLDKLHPNSNFYTSGSRVSDYPGRVFEVVEILKAYDKSLRKQRLNVISRNFPDAAPQIEKKLQLKPSDRDFLIATRSSEQGLIFIKAKLVSRGY